MFQFIKHMSELRMNKEEKIDGLDIHEYSLVNNYANFMNVDGVNGR